MNPNTIRATVARMNRKGTPTMNLKTRLDKFERDNDGNSTNPLIAGTHEHVTCITIGGANPNTDEWIVNKTTGERLPITPYWERMVAEYDATNPIADFTVNIGGPSNPEPDEIQ
jgi:hypothetical protein